MKLTKIYMLLFTVASISSLASKISCSYTHDEISVVALRDGSQYAKSNYNTSPLTQSDLSKYQPIGVADGLKSIPNLDIQSGARTLTQKPIIRG